MSTLAALIFIGGAIGINVITVANSSLETSYKESYKPVKIISRIIFLMNDSWGHMTFCLQQSLKNDYLKTQNNKKLLSAHIASIVDNIDESNSLLNKYNERNLTKEEQNKTDLFSDTHIQYINEGLIPAIDAIESKDFQAANTIFVSKINPYFKIATLQASDLLQVINQIQKDEYQEATKYFTLIRNSLILLTVLGILISFTAAILLIRSIVLPLNKAVAHFKQIAEGNMDENILAPSKDEIGQVLSGLAAMQEKLRIIIAELDQLASTDKLTGAWNRRRFEDTVEFEIDRLRRYGQRLSLMILDIDHFKKINDLYGHSIGDRVLIDLSSAILSTLRATDSLTRWGGEEFIILCPNTTAETVLKLAERVREKISSVKFEEVGSITLSFGVAECDPNETKEEWLQRADKALYLAKSAGRDQIKTTQSLPKALPKETNNASDSP
tara:strand:+ start:534 stop:1859 length:1326 start_codon:yes stop_codon:yes gene_type:complete